MRKTQTFDDTKVGVGDLVRTKDYGGGHPEHLSETVFQYLWTPINNYIWEKMKC